MNAAADPGLQPPEPLADRPTWLGAAVDDGLLSIHVASPGRERRHALAEHIEEQIECGLIQAGSCPRPPYVPNDADEILADQLYRARMLGFQGLALSLGSLHAICRDSVLDTADSRALSWWLERCEDKPLRLHLDPRDERLRRHAVPTGVTSTPQRAQPTAVPPVTRDLRRGNTAPTEPPLEEMELTNLDFPEEPPALAKTAPAAPCALRAAMRGLLADVEPLDDDSGAVSSNEAPGGTRPQHDASSEPEAPLPQPSIATATPGDSPARDSRAPRDSSTTRDDTASLHAAPTPVQFATAKLSERTAPRGAHPTVPEPIEAPAAESAATAAPGPVTVETRLALQPDDQELTFEATRPANAPTPEPDAATATRPDAAEPVATAPQQVAAEGQAPAGEGTAAAPEAQSSRGTNHDQAWLWKQALQTARGTQTWHDIQEMFCENYVPLQRAVLQGNAPLGSEQALTDWARDFSSSYTQVFEALRTRGKRPVLVLDAPNVAFRIARRHHAPQQRLVLVDALRYDIALGTADKLQLQLLGLADCVEQGVLWSALPATTPIQLELLARGPDGLRQLRGDLDEAQLQSQGNDIRKLRPMRVGPHHLAKLDVVSVLAQQHDTSYDLEFCERCAAEVAVSVARFIKQQPPSTLVFLFGDHGFGGRTMLPAPPEHVLTPYQAWLTRSQ